MSMPRFPSVYFWEYAFYIIYRQENFFPQRHYVILLLIFHIIWSCPPFLFSSLYHPLILFLMFFAGLLCLFTYTLPYLYLFLVLNLSLALASNFRITVCNSTFDLARIIALSANARHSWFWVNTESTLSFPPFFHYLLQ